MSRSSSVAAIAGIGWPVWVAGAALLVLLVNQASGGAIVRESAAGIAEGAVTAIGDVAGGAVLGIGDAVGVPRTDQSQCEADKAAGRWWDASFSCPAKDFVSGAWGALTGGQP